MPQKMEAETLPKRMLRSHAKWIQMEESVTNFTHATEIQKPDSAKTIGPQKIVRGT